MLNGGSPHPTAAGRGSSWNGSAGGATQEILTAVRRMAPLVSSLASQMESSRDIPAPVLAEMHELGVFRMITPASHGGLELSLADCCSVLAELAKLDGAVGWCAMVGAMAPLVLGMLPPDVYDEIYAFGPNVMVARSAAPGGRAEILDGTYRVEGRWPFASGCLHAQWLFGFCVPAKNGEPLPEIAPGAPSLRIVVLPAMRWTIEDSRHAEGLKGTGSHHICLSRTDVPASHVIDLHRPGAQPATPLARSGVSLLPTAHAAFAVGLAEGALADVIGLARSGTRQVFAATTLRNSEIFQYELGRALMDVRAARALMIEQCEIDWQDVAERRTHEVDRRHHRFATATWVTETCARAIQMCHRLGGARAVYESSPLQRRLRDVNAAAQHIAVNAKHYLGVGNWALV